MKKKKKWTRWIKWIVLLLIVAAVVAWFTVFQKQTEEASYTESVVSTGDLETFYNFDGLVSAKRVQTLTAEAADTVRTVYVSQNDHVSEGDRLYRTDGGTTVKADIDGEITLLSIEEGDVLTAGETTVQIIDMARLEVTLDVDEYDVAAVAPGTQADVTVLALDKRFVGTVTALDKNGTASGDLSYYTAHVALDDSEGVYPGMQISAKVLRSHAENAALVPMDAIQFDDYNKPYVIRRAPDGNGTENVPVTVGASDGVLCEIVEGVRAGETILIPNGMSMMELMQQMSDRGRSNRKAANQ